MVKVVHQEPTHTVSDEKTQGVLDKMRSQSIEETTARTASELGMRYLDLSIFPLDQEAVLMLSEEDSKRLGAVIFQKERPKLRVAITDPKNAEALEFFDTFAKSHDLEADFFLVSQPSLEKVWMEYEKKPLIESLDFMHVSLSGPDLEKFEQDFGDLLQLNKDSSSIPTSRILEIILAGAYKLRSSDIHFEPFGENVRLRYRIDGVLQEVGNLPKSVYQLALSRVKMMAKMKINIRNRSQDGHFSAE
nr:Flp pilus assembly complex ATPase component TadA [Candidatus Moranbacteria bacterium]